jgi:hypothetical protein
LVAGTLPQAGTSFFEVESILNHKDENGKRFYLVKWMGYPLEDATWEPVENIATVTCIEDYWRIRTLASRQNQQDITQEHS